MKTSKGTNKMKTIIAVLMAVFAMACAARPIAEGLHSDNGEIYLTPRKRVVSGIELQVIAERKAAARRAKEWEEAEEKRKAAAARLQAQEKAKEQWILKNYKTVHAKLKAEERELYKQFKNTRDQEALLKWTLARVRVGDLERAYSDIVSKRSGSIK